MSAVKPDLAPIDVAAYIVMLKSMHSGAKPNVDYRDVYGTSTSNNRDINDLLDKKDEYPVISWIYQSTMPIYN